MISDQKSNIKDQIQVKKSKMDVKYRAFYLSIDVIRFVEKVENRLAFRIISDQLIRSVTSIGANIVEAKAASSKREFKNYFQISLKSSNEAKYWLAMLRELMPNKKEEIDIFLKEVDEVSKIIGTSVLTMKGKRKI